MDVDKWFYDWYHLFYSFCNPSNTEFFIEEHGCVIGGAELRTKYYYDSRDVNVYYIANNAIVEPIESSYKKKILFFYVTEKITDTINPYSNIEYSRYSGQYGYGYHSGEGYKLLSNFPETQEQFSTYYFGINIPNNSIGFGASQSVTQGEIRILNS